MYALLFSFSVGCTPTNPPPECDDTAAWNRYVCSDVGQGDCVRFVCVSVAGGPCETELSPIVGVILNEETEPLLVPIDCQDGPAYTPDIEWVDI